MARIPICRRRMLEGETIMAGKPHSSFDQDSETQRKATEAAQSSEAKLKRHNTILINKLI